MKAVILLSALVAIVGVSATPAQINSQRGLQEDLNEFLALVPIDELAKLALGYFQNDKEIQDAFAYMQGKEFAAIWDQLFALKEVKDLLNYLEKAGLKVYDALNTVADFFGLNHVKPIRSTLKTGGLNGFLEEAIALLPKDKLKALFEEKLKTSPEFKALFEKLQHADFQKLVEFYNNSKEVQSLFTKLREHGIDVDKIIELVAGFFGWGRFY
ncbi:protein G12-like [Uranotaenia lowii]|uniref:protein G12-like n=1 Tax=Uranotaenia lowii TaxID=190385 RepID=UPI002478F7E6|nr:protein G12-like [Uranotaenia lowii]